MALAALPAPHAYLQAQARWHPIEIAFWLATLLPFWFFESYLVLASQIAITALFALSLDIILGYAGIVSLGHAAFFGIGSYAAGLIAKHYWGEPISGLILSAALAGLAGYAASFIIARFRHLALIMITLGLGLLLHEAANSAPGVGLGLALSRRLAIDLGGKLELQSPADGGAAFVLTLPR